MSGSTAGEGFEGSVLSLVAAAGTFEDALGVTLRLACEAGGWDHGAAWLPATDDSTRVVAGPRYVPERSLPSPDGADDGSTVTGPTSAESRGASAASGHTSVTSGRASIGAGEGLVGRALASGAVEWLDGSDSVELPDDGETVASTAVADRSEVASAVAVPVVVDGEILAVLAFSATRPHSTDGAFAGAVAATVETFARSFAPATEAGADQLAEKNRQLESFAAVLSHDVRSPLAVATGFLDLARETGDLSYLDRVERAHERIEELIDTLLVLARKGRMVGATTGVDLAAPAREAWDVTDAKDATLEVGDVGTVEADPARLKQLLENLFGNAVQHGGDAVRVRVLSLEGEEGFAVEDDGPGIPPELRAEVLRPGHESSGGGYGLGLSIVAAVAEGHGWDLHLTEGSDGGARFEFRTDRSGGTCPRRPRAEGPSLTADELSLMADRPRGSTLQGLSASPVE